MQDGLHFISFVFQSDKHLSVTVFPIKGPVRFLNGDQLLNHVGGAERLAPVAWPTVSQSALRGRKTALAAGLELL